MRAVPLNPVLDRELRQRSRSIISMILITAFLALLILVMFLSYKATESTANISNDPISALTVQVGRSMFEWVLFFELIVLVFLIPGISAGAIAGERDRQTLIPLQVTLVGPLGIFGGKVLASASFVLLLLVASTPVLAVPYLVGGISLTNVLSGLGSLLAIGILMAIMGVGCSAIFRRTLTATLAAYAVALALILGTLVGVVALTVIDGMRGTDEATPRLEPLYPNPFLAVSDATGDLGAPGNGPFSPVKNLYVEIQIEQQNRPDVFVEQGVMFDGRTGEQIEVDEVGGLLPLWARSLLSQAAIALVLGVLGVRRLRAPSKELQT